MERPTYRSIREGTFKKGGQNSRPTSPRPAPPEGQKPIGPPNERVPCSCSYCSVRQRIERAIRKPRYERAINIEKREEA